METMLNNAGLYPTEIFVDDILELFNKSHRTIPQLYYKGKCLGGADDLEKHNSSLNTLKLYIKQGPDLK
jgi:glutaredoxin-related protein